jgi:cellulose synthase/poly-beta-1,6-N-acetylglucosamine synthase-like glycosyltransferase
MPHEPYISVIVPAYNAQETVEECIRSLLALAFARGDFEILLVDNASTDGTSDIVARYSNDVRVLYEGKRGAAAARNRGLFNARGKVVAFTDADCIVDKDWLQEIVSPLKDHRVGIAGGRILSRRPCNAIEMFGERIHDHHKAINVYRPPYVNTANWSSRLSVLEEAGFFDESFLRGQDTDLAWRIAQYGYRLVYAPRAVIYHRNRSTVLGLFKEGYVHGYHSVKILQKHEMFLQQYRRGISAALTSRTRGFDFSDCTQRGRARQLFYWATFRLGKRAGKTLGSLGALCRGAQRLMGPTSDWRRGS